MKNKTVIRIENIPGRFTTVNHKILRDKRLTSNAKILLIEILSDTDGFILKPSTYKNRMVIEDTAYDNAIENLIECGYLRKKKIGKSHYNHYTISEYGNLNIDNETIDELLPEQDETPEGSNVKAPVSKINSGQLDKLGIYLMSVKSFATDEITLNFTKMLNEDLDYYQFKSKLEKMISKEQKLYFKDISKQVEVAPSLDSKAKKEALKILKTEIFDKNNTVLFETVSRRATQNINSRKPIDPESLAADRADGI